MYNNCTLYLQVSIALTGKFQIFFQHRLRLPSRPEPANFGWRRSRKDFSKAQTEAGQKRPGYATLVGKSTRVSFQLFKYCQCEIFYLFINVRTIFARTIADHFFQYRRAACISVLKDQVRMEFEASLQYLLMGAFFTQVRGRSNSSIFYHFSAWQFMFCSASF